ncbi:hypothetical protein BH10ACT7_BH10ACT7_24180 [soil metagenome]
MDEQYRRAPLLFVGTSIVAAITVGAMLVGGWGGGVLDNRIEWVFWAGAILAAAGIALFGAAAVIAGPAFRLIRAGMALFLLGPALAVIAVFTDYWI